MRVRPPRPLELGVPGLSCRVVIQTKCSSTVASSRGSPPPLAAEPRQVTVYPRPGDPGQRDTDDAGGWLDRPLPARHPMDAVVLGTLGQLKCTAPAKWSSISVGSSSPARAARGYHRRYGGRRDRRLRRADPREAFLSERGSVAARADSAGVEPRRSFMRLIGRIRRAYRCYEGACAREARWRGARVWPGVGGVGWPGHRCWRASRS